MPVASLGTVFNDFQVRPLYLPDFGVPVTTEQPTQVVNERVGRLRKYLRERFAVQKGLVDVFRRFATDSQIDPDGMTTALKSMGVHITPAESKLLVKLADPDDKGFLRFEDFSFFVYHDIPEAKRYSEVFAQHALMEKLAAVSPILNRKFVDLGLGPSEGVTPNSLGSSPMHDHSHLVTLPQFRAALSGTFPTEITDYVWRMQFPDGAPIDRIKGGLVDWRSFLYNVKASQKPPEEPVFIQSRETSVNHRKRLSGILGFGSTPPPPERVGEKGQVQLVGSELRFRIKDTEDQPETVGLQSVSWIDKMRGRADRAVNGMRMYVEEDVIKKALNKGGDGGRVSRSEAVEALRAVVRGEVRLDQHELEEEADCDQASQHRKVSGVKNFPPGAIRIGIGLRGSIRAEAGEELKESLLFSSLKEEAQEGRKEIKLRRSLIGPAFEPSDILKAAQPESPSSQPVTVPKSETLLAGFSGEPQWIRERLSVERNRTFVASRLDGDIAALLDTQVADKDGLVDVDELLHRIYRTHPSIRFRVQDSLKKGGRKLRPVVSDANLEEQHSPSLPTSTRLSPNGSPVSAPCHVTDVAAEIGRVFGDPGGAKLFSKLDSDGDGYVTKKDLIDAVRKRGARFGGRQISDSEVCELFHAIDVDRKGSVNMSEFLQNFKTERGELVDSMGKQIIGVQDRGGPEYLSKTISTARGLGDLGWEVPEAISGNLCMQSPQMETARSQRSIVGSSRITDVKRMIVAGFKPRRAEWQGKTRYGATAYFDTRFLTEPLTDLPCNASYLPPDQRFRTSTNSMQIGMQPDLQIPYFADKKRNQELKERKEARKRAQESRLDASKASGQAAADRHDAMRIARVGMKLLDYEHKVKSNPL